MAPQEDFYDAIEAASVSPLWRQFNGEQPTEPSPLPPFIWRWSTLAPLTERAANEVPMEDVERRVLSLKNPHRGVAGPGTTKNLVGALQTLLPGETAVAHRHSGNALRFVLEGNGAETIVDGKTCLMEERDLILTPLLSWHAHRHTASDRIVWFDALDVPLFRHMNASFYQEGPPPNLPPQTPDAAFLNGGLTPEDGNARPSYSPMFRYPWKSVLQALSDMPAANDGSRKLRYTNPSTGGPAMTLIDCYMLALANNRETVPYRTTSDAICVVADGEGESDIGDHHFTWQRNDIFTLPNWSWISHRALSGDAKLFTVTDRDAIDRLGMLREERREELC